MKTLKLGPREVDALWTLVLEGWGAYVDLPPRELPSKERKAMERVIEKLQALY